MFRSLLIVLGVVVAVLGCGFVPETAYVPEDAEEATNNWLVDFTHTNLDYVDQAKSAFAYAADGSFCKAGWKFDDIVADARDRDGSREPVAAYNAGVLYVVAGWEGRVYCDTSRRRDAEPINRLEYALKHMPDRSMDAAIHMLLGNSYYHALSEPRYGGSSAEYREKSIEHYCKAQSLNSFYQDQVEERFQGANWEPCESEE